MPPEHLRDVFVVVFAGGLERGLASTVWKRGIGATAQQRFDGLHTAPGSRIKQWSCPRFLIACIDFGAVIQQKLYHFGIASQGGVV